MEALLFIKVVQTLKNYQWLYNYFAPIRQLALDTSFAWAG